MFHVEYEGTLQHALSNGYNLFTGSGFSTLAYDKNIDPLPTGSELKQEIIDHFDVNNLSRLPIERICTILEKTKRNELYDFLINRLKVQSFSDLYLNLEKTKIVNVFSTNIDDLFFKVFGSSVVYYVNDTTIKGPVVGDRDVINYTPLHGCVSHQPPRFVFSSQDLVSTFNDDRDKWHFLTEAIQRKPTIFIGYSMNDAGVIESLSPTTVNERKHKEKWIVLHNAEPEAIEYFKALNFNIIIGETNDFLQYIGDNITAAPSDEIVAGSLFDQEHQLPSPDKVIVRPVTDFFEGAAPIWSDIYSGMIPTTAHYKSIIDSLYSGIHTIVVGMPTCGKTTLIMQAANDIQFNGVKLFYDSMTYERAKYLLNSIHDTKVLVFVDNLADDVGAINLLMNSNNFIVCAAEQDYNFDIISHYIDRSVTNIINVTSMNDDDFALIYNKIPEQIRKRNRIRPIVAEGIMPSVFEFVETNITLPNVKTRLNNSIRTLRSNNEWLYNLLIMCCYVHYCRTPVSYDMVHSFLRDVTHDFNEVYELLDRVGSLIVEFQGPARAVDSEQDHFVPRSYIFSKSILDLANQISLKNVITRFHNEVTPYRICKYDLFKKKAYDSKIMAKAFTDYEEGMEFYTEMYFRDDSPYIKQQGALYLASKKKYELAFSWIDEALTRTHSKIFSIRNTHAIILFNANIEKEGPESEVKHILSRSMDILFECYNHDKRKIYHCACYAEQAVKYYDRFADDRGVEYLQTAHAWLIEEKKQSPWNRNIARLYRSVSSKLSRI